MEYTVKADHRHGPNINVVLCDDNGKRLYDRYVSTDDWGIDPEGVAATLVKYWESELAKAAQAAAIQLEPISEVVVTLTAQEASLKVATMEKTKKDAV